MGHSVHVHEDFYRLPSHTLELAKVSKLLIAVEAEDLAQLNGKTLNNLNTEDIPDSCLVEEGESPDEADTDDGQPTTSRQSFSVSDNNEEVGDIDVTEDVEPSSDDDDNDIPCKKQRKMLVRKRERKGENSQVITLPRPAAKKCPKGRLHQRRLKSRVNLSLIHI